MLLMRGQMLLMHCLLLVLQWQIHLELLLSLLQLGWQQWHLLLTCLV